MSGDASDRTAESCRECLSARTPRCAIICLANSRKHGFHCIAGICPLTGAWVRPISRLTNGSLPEGAILVDGEQPKLLQIVEFPFRTLHARTFGFQSENRELAPGIWRATGRASVQDILPCCENSEFILYNELDRVPLAHLQALPSHRRKSLQLVHCDDVAFHETSSTSGRQQCRARIRWGRIEYHLVVTDPEIERRVYGGEPVGGHCILTVSLGMPFPEGSQAPDCFKLVAGVVEL
jgi:hypothetical protein